MRQLVWKKLFWKRGRGRWERKLEKTQSPREILFVFCFFKLKRDLNSSLRVQENWYRLSDEYIVKRMPGTHGVFSLKRWPEWGSEWNLPSLLHFAAFAFTCCLFCSHLLRSTTSLTNSHRRHTLPGNGRAGHRERDLLVEDWVIMENIGLAKKFVQVQKNPNKLFGQPYITTRFLKFYSE